MEKHENPLEIRRQRVTRYIAPLREGGSLPAIAEADDGFKYVVKFRGAGHGAKALIAEFLGALVAQRLGFNVPEPVLLDVGEEFGRSEGDEEIQDLLKASRGLNFGLHFLSGAMTVDPYVNGIDEDTASRVVWLDAFLTNVDRTVLNTNLLIRDGKIWLIDHGASFIFHHSWNNPAEAALYPFTYINRHALLPRASRLKEADAYMRQKITPRTLEKIVALIPEEWLVSDNADMTPEEIRQGYSTFLTTRLANSSIFVNQAIHERDKLK